MPLSRFCTMQFRTSDNPHRDLWGMCYSLFAGARDVAWYSVFTVHDHGEGLTIVGLLKRWLAAYQHKEDDTKAPDICGTRDKIRKNTFCVQVIRTTSSKRSQHDQTTGSCCKLYGFTTRKCVNNVRIRLS